MSDQGEEYQRSWILYQYLDWWIGSEEIVDIRRKGVDIQENVINADKDLMHDKYMTGSRSEGFDMKGSDGDFMFIDRNVVVLCPDQMNSLPPNRDDKSVLWMRPANSRPGYVTLEVVYLGGQVNTEFHYAIVEDQEDQKDRYFLSSEKFKQNLVKAIGHILKISTETHGPAATFHACNVDMDYAGSFKCLHWPKEASEWVIRPRLHGWPDQSLKDEIVHDGCYLVPKGDITSPDTFLQWSISFATAERKLVYSLNRVQFLVYGLLKYFLKQISDTLKEIIGDTDILSSYIMKTVVFHAVDKTPCSLWQEKHTFICFMLCLNILITWVKAGHCPNYFIPTNNMFLGKFHRGNQQKLLHFLLNLHDMKWACLSVGTFMQPTIGDVVDRLCNVTHGRLSFLPSLSESERDLELFNSARQYDATSASLPVSLTLLSKTKTENNEFLAYVTTTHSLSNVAMDKFREHTACRGNKEKYKYLRKCKIFLSPGASVCTSPGLLGLATYYYQTGNYTKTLDICRHRITSFKICCPPINKDMKKYVTLFCGRGYTLFAKFKEAYASPIFIPHDCLYPSEIYQITKIQRGDCLPIPSLPYSVFLSFLYYNELGDTKRRDAAVLDLRIIKYDESRGSSVLDSVWIVHNMLGFCYEIAGDTQRALIEYRNSIACSSEVTQFMNNAKERIDRL
ncbi:uncharacterized protein [Argopecten irradians]|uniref:uncharacterized protein n=1 Tax=Argopecten irradians TaxID=31199 RepID=UPI0037112260